MAPQLAPRIELPAPRPITPKACNCGGSAWLYGYRGRFGKVFWVECSRCEATSLEYERGADAVEKWNAK